MGEGSRRRVFSREQQGRNRKNDGRHGLGCRVQVHVVVSQGSRPYDLRNIKHTGEKFWL